MGNIADELIAEWRLNMLAEGCPTHNHRAMSEDGHCLLCEKNMEDD